jgi:hypothetical protein
MSIQMIFMLFSLMSLKTFGKCQFPPPFSSLSTWLCLFLPRSIDHHSPTRYDTKLRSKYKHSRAQPPSSSSLAFGHGVVLLLPCTWPVVHCLEALTLLENEISLTGQTDEIVPFQIEIGEISDCRYTNIGRLAWSVVTDGQRCGPQGVWILTCVLSDTHGNS